MNQPPLAQRRVSFNKRNGSRFLFLQKRLVWFSKKKYLQTHTNKKRDEMVSSILHNLHDQCYPVGQYDAAESDAQTSHFPFG